MAGVHRNLFLLVKDYLSERKLVYQIQTSRVEHGYSKGCPQGSKTEPLYANLIS